MLTGCMHFYGARIICGDNYAGGAEAENAGTAAEWISTQHLGNFTELQEAKETSGPQGIKPVLLVDRRGSDYRRFLLSLCVCGFVLSHYFKGRKRNI